MSKRTKWLVAMMIALAVLSVASIALANTIYLPIVHKSATWTPTLQPSATPTRTVTPTPQAGVLITHIEADPKGPDIENEFVTVKNNTNSSVDLTDWTLVDQASTVFTFPDGFRLGSGREVKIWSKGGEDTSTDLYWGLASAIWDNLSDCAYLYDDDDDQVHEFCYTRMP